MWVPLAVSRYWQPSAESLHWHRIYGGHHIGGRLNIVKLLRPDYLESRNARIWRREQSEAQAKSQEHPVAPSSKRKRRSRDGWTEVALTWPMP